jgi:Holliday junction DNA helicase RuvA
MIAFLRGILTDRDGAGVVLDVSGVGYAVTVTASVDRSLPPVGTEVALFIYTHAVTDGGLQLFGFSDADERRLFETLLSVQGVGPKVAVAMVSAMPAAELVRAIATGDVGKLKQMRGVGQKLAERLTVELRDKVGLLAAGAGRALPAALPRPVPAGRLGEVHGALVSLGYKPVEVESLLGKLDAELPAADLVKTALAALRRR